MPLSTWDYMQKYNLPAPGSLIIFDKIPGASYASKGEIYKVGWSKDGYMQVYITRIVDGKETSGTYDGFSAWQGAEWHHADGKPGRY